MKMDHHDTPTTDLYTELQQVEELFFGLRSRKKGTTRHRAELQVITQNLQGFIKERRKGWLRGWKQRTNATPADIIFVQDTHIKTQEEIEEVKAAWNITHGFEIPRLDVGQHLRSHWIKPTEIVLQRSSLMGLFLGGDFNAVLQPSLDRITKGLPSANSCESITLNRLVDSLDLLDAVNLTSHADDDCIPDPMMHFSFWRDHSASRLDRFYLNTKIAGIVQWIEARLPVSKSDHQEVRERTSAYYSNLRTSLNRETNSRDDYQQIYGNARIRQGQNAFGRRLQPILANLKRFYKRHAN
ncbi:hypothetical protein PHMEG_00025023 [Phytophthora megakarya]|uniref:Endonuclease/exonuclease/phosphatase domain-containing protein n=1 Tax=Phytophthora megakarya TaxID=4795 RepID=A0A225VEA1_9STRA|nr:hypothetical protein PHMEG_00025023 [Phytophthora megakarya]